MINLMVLHAYSINSKIYQERHRKFYRNYAVSGSALRGYLTWTDFSKTKVMQKIYQIKVPVNPLLLMIINLICSYEKLKDHVYRKILHHGKTVSWKMLRAHFQAQRFDENTILWKTWMLKFFDLLSQSSTKSLHVQELLTWYGWVVSYPQLL